MTTQDLKHVATVTYVDWNVALTHRQTMYCMHFYHEKVACMDYLAVSMPA